MIKFHCNQCSTGAKAKLLITDNPSDRCHCPDLPERFRDHFWGSVLERQAMEAVKENRRLNEVEEAEFKMEAD
jgi:hypothetical protein